MFGMHSTPNRCKMLLQDRIGSKPNLVISEESFTVVLRPKTLDLHILILVATSQHRLPKSERAMLEGQSENNKLESQIRRIISNVCVTKG